MSLGKRHWELGSIPHRPYQSFLLKKEVLRCRMQCTSRIPDTRAISGQGMAKTASAAVTA
jgi:hypothetical protein